MYRFHFGPGHAARKSRFQRFAHVRTRHTVPVYRYSVYNTVLYCSGLSVYVFRPPGIFERSFDEGAKL